MEEINKFIKGKEIFILIIIAAIVAHYLFMNSIGDKAEKLKDWLKPDIDDIDSATADWLNDQIKINDPPTIQPETAKRYADVLRNAVAGWGTDEDAVYDVLNLLRNKSDFYTIMRFFGTVEGKNLVQMFQSDEFTLDERLKINNILNRIGLSIKVN